MKFAAGFVAGIVFVVVAVIGAVEWTFRDGEK